MGSIREERHQEGASHWLWWPQSHEELPNTPKHALFSQRGHQRMLPKPPGPCPGAAPRLAWVAACSWAQSRGLERDGKLHHNHAAPPTTQQPQPHNQAAPTGPSTLLTVWDHKQERRPHSSAILRLPPLPPEGLQKLPSSPFYLLRVSLFPATPHSAAPHHFLSTLLGCR